MIFSIVLELSQSGPASNNLSKAKKEAGLDAKSNIVECADYDQMASNITEYRQVLVSKL